MFWSDKASSYYSLKTTNFLNNKGINFVPKEVNPTEVPQCRPIEDFFGVLATHVYARNWIAGDAEALKRRIRACIKKIPEQTVQAASVAVRKRLLRAYRGLLSVCHCISVQNRPNFNIVSLILTTTELIDPIKGSEISSIFFVITRYTFLYIYFLDEIRKFISFGSGF